MVHERICSVEAACDKSTCPHHRVMMGKPPYTMRAYWGRCIWKLIELIFIIVAFILLIFLARYVDNNENLVYTIVTIKFAAIVVTAVMIVLFIATMSYIICSPITRAVDVTLCTLIILILLMTIIFIFLPWILSPLCRPERYRHRGIHRRGIPGESRIMEGSFNVEEVSLFNSTQRSHDSEESDLNKLLLTYKSTVIPNKKVSTVYATRRRPTDSILKPADDLGFYRDVQLIPLEVIDGENNKKVKNHKKKYRSINLKKFKSRIVKAETTPRQSMIENRNQSIFRRKSLKYMEQLLGLLKLAMENATRLEIKDENTYNTQEDFISNQNGLGVERLTTSILDPEPNPTDERGLSSLYTLSTNLQVETTPQYWKLQELEKLQEKLKYVIGLLERRNEEKPYTKPFYGVRENGSESQGSNEGSNEGGDEKSCNPNEKKLIIVIMSLLIILVFILLMDIIRMGLYDAYF